MKNFHYFTHKNILLSSLFFCGLCDADQSQTNNKPLWTERLPEQNKKPQQNVPNLDINATLEIDRNLFNDEFDTDSSQIESAEPITELPKDAPTYPTSSTAQAPINEKPSNAVPVITASVKKSEAVQSTETSALNNTTQTVQYWKVISQPTLNYPKLALRQKKEGWVDLKVAISPQGTVNSSEVINTSSNSNIFIRSAQQAVRNWKFTPPASRGIDEEVYSTVRVNYTLPKL